jgi:hypothetical protein
MVARFIARSGSRPERVAADANAARAQRECNAGAVAPAGIDPD